ncbi:hypothetical protein ACFYYB_33410 [Streptomyces sp. NPDC002886]|uniref:hypothetical protein n=1 Tax=Streptomyces sp. NPDC002886 TaxID=3364667 RepID=UPI0036BEE240
MTPQPLWQAALATATAVIDAHDKRIPELRDDRTRAFTTWGIAQEIGEGSIRTLLALALHSLAQDAKAAGHPAPWQAISTTTLTAAADRVNKWPKHELLAGLETTAISDDEQYFTNLIKVLIHSADDKGELALERLSRATQRVTEALARHQPADAQTCGDIHPSR